MKKSKALSLTACVLFLGSVSTGCSTSETKSPDVADKVRRDLDQGNFRDVSVSQDRDQGVITLTGHVGSDADKSQAESIAKAESAAWDRQKQVWS